MEFEIRHRMKGRLRIALPLFLRDADALSRFSAWMSARAAGSTVRFNAACASVAVEYPPSVVDESALLDAVRALRPQDLQTEAVQTSAAMRTDPAFAVATLALVLSMAEAPIAFAGCCLCVVYAAWPSYVNAYSVWRREGRMNVDLLDSLAITLSLARANFFTGALMAWLIRLGDWIRDRTAARSSRAIKGLLDYQSARCWTLRGDEKVEVSVNEIELGDVVVMYAGGVLPVDGEVVRGHATVDQRAITGESLPVEKRRRDKVYAGTSIHEGQLYVKATAVRSETMVARIVRMVEETAVGETRIQNYAEKFADRLVAPSLGLSVGLFALSGNMERLLSMLIVDYGTGIRVAAPTAVLASIMDAARRGVVIKSGSAMEKLSQANTIVFDKTGTVTRGVPQILDIVSYSPHHFPERHILALAAAAEIRLKHPVAHAVIDKARQARLDIPERKLSQFRIGRGVEARINGYQVHVGSARFLQENAIRLQRAHGELRRFHEHGCSALFVAVNGELVGLLSYADEVRPEMRSVVQALHRRGIRDLMMLTGDNGAVAQAVATTLGLDHFVADILPGEKAEIVKERREAGRVVAMVGDGINDSPAFACADVGVSMKNGTDVTRQVANVVLMEDHMSKLVTALDVSRQATRLIRENFAIIAGLNTLALALAIPAGLVNPGVTALISNGSAILASLNAVRPVLRYV